METERLTSPTLRIAMATAIILSGKSVTTREMSERLGVSTRGARYVFEKLSAIFPILHDDGAWRLLRDEDFTD